MNTTQNRFLASGWHHSAFDAAPVMLDAHRPSVRDFDAKLVKLGFRPCTPEESRSAREAIARTDAMIARQLAGA